MSIVLKCTLGYLVDHEEYITSTCDSLQYKSCPYIFNTFEPYIKAKDETSGSSASHISGKKRRKRKHPLNSGEVMALEYHEKIREKIKGGLEALSKLEQWDNYFKSDLEKKTETRSFLEAAAACCNILSALEETEMNLVSLHPVEDAVYGLYDVMNRVVYNKNKNAILLSISEAKYIIPPRSKFLLSDIMYLNNLTEVLDSSYDLIVIDPPWENKSVKRGAKYSSLSLLEIKELPIRKLASDQTMVIVWITNKQKYRKFVLDELFPSWSCTFVAEWHWIKLTKRGEMIYDLESSHKKPYEPLLIGKIERVETTRYSETEQNVGERSLPEHQVICSVPSSLHSRKPPLKDILNEYLPDDAKCIELFARNLTPNWTSWGNEVLKFQHLDYFQRKET